jgi:hypothetical protein
VPHRLRLLFDSRQVLRHSFRFRSFIYLPPSVFISANLRRLFSSISGDLWQSLAILAIPITPPLPPGFHPISPKLTQRTQGSAEGYSPKMSKPGVKAGCAKS